MDRATFETRLFGVLRWVVIAVLVVVTLLPVLLHGAALDPADRGGAAGPRRSLGRPGGMDGRDVPRGARPGRATVARASCGCSSTRAGGRVAATVLTLLVSIPGSYAVSRLRFVGRRQVHFLFLSVYLFPAILLAIPLFILFTRLGLRGSLVGLIDRLHRADRPGVDLHAAQLPDHDPGEPRGGGRGRRLHTVTNPA